MYVEGTFNTLTYSLRTGSWLDLALRGLGVERTRRDSLTGCVGPDTAWVSGDCASHPKVSQQRRFEE